MKIEFFTDSFFDSLKRLTDSERWYNKAWISDGVPNFLKNVWAFRKSLWNHRWYDYRYNVEILRDSLAITVAGMESKGMEVAETRSKKVEKMHRAIQLLTNIIDDSFIDSAEAELGPLVLHDWEFEPVPGKPEHSRLIEKDTPEEKENNRKIFARAQEIQEQEWKELWSIFQGQDYSTFDKTKDWNDFFDGSGFRNWWD